MTAIFARQRPTSRRPANLVASMPQRLSSVAIDNISTVDKVGAMAPKHPAAESLPPLTPAVFHILMAVAEEDRHGYAIIQDVAERTRARCG